MAALCERKAPDAKYPLKLGAALKNEDNILSPSGPQAYSCALLHNREFASKNSINRRFKVKHQSFGKSTIQLETEE